MRNVGIFIPINENKSKYYIKDLYKDFKKKLVDIKLANFTFLQLPILHTSNKANDFLNIDPRFLSYEWLFDHNLINRLPLSDDDKINLIYEAFDNYKVDFAYDNFIKNHHYLAKASKDTCYTQFFLFLQLQEIIEYANKIGIELYGHYGELSVLYKLDNIYKYFIIKGVLYHDKGKYDYDIENIGKIIDSENIIQQYSSYKVISSDIKTNITLDFKNENLKTILNLDADILILNVDNLIDNDNFSTYIHQLRLMIINSRRTTNLSYDTYAYLDNYNTLNIETNNLDNRRFHLYQEEKRYLTLISHNTIDNRYTYTFNEKIDFDNNYYIYDQNNNKYPIMNRYICKTKRFEEKYFYGVKDLGPNYTILATTFKVWSPFATKAYVLIDEKLYPMTKHVGVFEVTIDQDLKNVLYNYVISINHQVTITCDPYALSNNANGVKSAVIDKDEYLVKDYYNTNKDYLNSIIYELHLRDFTYQFKDQAKSIFLANALKNVKLNNVSVGLDHLIELGITHVQLLPVFEYATVDDLAVNDSYNWGYDPLSYNSLKGGYSSDPNNPLSRIEEFKYLVNTYHQNNIGVNLDVVFNHVYCYEIFSLNQLMPYYYIRSKNFELSNGSFCGNDLESQAKMMHEYILDMCLSYIKYYDIDGLRFDLMGILDYQIINRINLEAKKIKPNFMVYGEGWNMPTFLDNNMKATQFNHQLMPEIAFFNDNFRNKIKFLFVENTNINDIYNSFLGKSFSLSAQSINYVSCHDNHTIFDFLTTKNQTDIISKIKVLNSITLLSLGIPFIHAGQEFGRTKKLEENSYNLSDEINKVDWSLKVENKDLFEYTKNIIHLRNNHKFYDLEIKEKLLTKIMYFNEMIYCFINDYFFVINCSNQIKEINDQEYSLIISSLDNTSYTLKPYSISIYKVK